MPAARFEVSKNHQQLLDATVQTAGAQVEQARARVAAAKAALDRAEETLSYATIRAPIAGIVLTRDTELGDAVSSILNLGSAATLIMTLGDVSSVYIKGEVDEADIGKADCGQHVRTKVEAYPNESFDGVVKRIAPMGKELNNVTTFEVRVSISNPQGKLRANMTANAEIVLEERKNVLLVPEAALVYDKDKNVSVQRLDPTARQGWRKVPLKIGISNGQRTEVLDGTQGRRQAGLAVTLAGEILIQTVRNIWAHKLRSTLTMFGISWGIASIVFMIAIGEGFKIGYRNALYTMGTDLVILWSGRTTKQAGGQRAGRDVRFVYEDIRAIQQECYLVRHVTGELAGSFQMRSRFNSGVFSTHGITPVYQQIRSMNLATGRLISETDMREERAVCVIGDVVKQQLFAGRQAVGAQIYIGDVPFTVIGEMAKKDQNNSYNGLDGYKVLIPYTAMARHFPDPRPFIGPGHIDNILFMPTSAADHLQAVKQVRRLLGRRHGFEPDDRGAVWCWDTVQQAQMVSGIYDSMELFLGFVALITLALGGVGVMNIMLVSVAERTREIGIKQAVGATPGRILFEFFLESVALTIFSGLVGLALAWCHLRAGQPAAPADHVRRAARRRHHGAVGLRHAGAGRDSRGHLPRPPRLPDGPGRSLEVRMIRHIFSEALNALGPLPAPVGPDHAQHHVGRGLADALAGLRPGIRARPDQAFLQIGKDLVVIFPGQTSLQAGGQRSGRRYPPRTQRRQGDPGRRARGRIRFTRSQAPLSLSLFNDRTRSYSVSGVYACYERIRETVVGRPGGFCPRKTCCTGAASWSSARTSGMNCSAACRRSAARSASTASGSQSLVCCGRRPKSPTTRHRTT